MTAARQDDRSRDDGARERAPSGFVKTGDPAVAASPGFHFKFAGGSHAVAYSVRAATHAPRGRQNRKELGLRGCRRFFRRIRRLSRAHGPGLCFALSHKLPIFDPGELALLPAQVIELGPAHFSLAHYVDLRDDRRMNREYSLHAD